MTILFCVYRFFSWKSRHSNRDRFSAYGKISSLSRILLFFEFWGNIFLHFFFSKLFLFVFYSVLFQYLLTFLFLHYSFLVIFLSLLILVLFVFLFWFSSFSCFYSIVFISLLGFWTWLLRRSLMVSKLLWLDQLRPNDEFDTLSHLNYV